MYITVLPYTHPTTAADVYHMYITVLPHANRHCRSNVSIMLTYVTVIFTDYTINID